MLDAVMNRLPLEIARDLKPRALVIGDLSIEPTEVGVFMSIGRDADDGAMLGASGVEALIAVLVAWQGAADTPPETTMTPALPVA